MSRDSKAEIERWENFVKVLSELHLGNQDEIEKQVQECKQ